MKAKQMTIEARIERTINTGNYQNVKVMGGGSVTFDLEEGEDYLQVFDDQNTALFNAAKEQVKSQEKIIRNRANVEEELE